MNKLSYKKLSMLFSVILDTTRKKTMKHLYRHSLIFLFLFVASLLSPSLSLSSEYECYAVKKIVGVWIPYPSHNIYTHDYDSHKGDGYLEDYPDAYGYLYLTENDTIAGDRVRTHYCEQTTTGNVTHYYITDYRTIGVSDIFRSKPDLQNLIWGWSGIEWVKLSSPLENLYFLPDVFFNPFGDLESVLYSGQDPLYAFPCGCVPPNEEGVCLDPCNLKITEFRPFYYERTLQHHYGDRYFGTRRVFLRKAAGTDFDGSDYSDGWGYKWQITVAGQTLRLFSNVWWSRYLDGPNKGKIIDPGEYSYSLKVWDSPNTWDEDYKCEDTVTKSLLIEYVDDSCDLYVEFGSSANVANGNLSHSQELFTTSGAGLATDISLYYNSTDPYYGSLGTGWNHSYGISLTEQSTGHILLRTGKGRRKLYRLDNGVYLSPRGDYSTLTKNIDNTFSLIKRDGREYLFSSEGLLLSIIDRNDNSMQFTYDNNLLTTITDAAGRITGFSYDASGKLVTITGPDGKIYSFKVINDMLAGITYSDGGHWDYTYDDYGFILSKVDPAGYTTTYSYDDEYRVATSVDPEGNVRALYYPSDDEGETDVLTTELVEKDGTVWQYEYDAYLGDLLGKVDAEGNVTSYTHDDEGNTLSETGPDGKTTSYTYDAVGNRTSITDPAGDTTTYTYNDYGQTTSIKDSQGDTTSYTYDDRGNQTAVTDPVGNITKYQYDSQGRITLITNPAGQTSGMTYDGYGNIATMTDATGNSTIFTYDTGGNLISQKDSLGNVTTFEYDNSGNMIKVVDSQGNVSAYSYDANGNRTATTDANGNSTYSTYNYKGQVFSTTDALGNVTTYEYGSSGCSSCSASPDKLTSLTDANGNTTTFIYDVMGRLEKEINPLGKATSYTYDVSGNMTSRTDANGNTILYSYDILGRLQTKTYPDQTVTSFTYDAKGNMLTAANQDIAYAMQYDKQGRLTMVSDSNGKAISSVYDVLGNRTKMITPNGKTITYGYDSGNRLSGINSWAGDITFVYDDLGRRTSLNYPNKVTSTYDYDQLGNLTRIMARNGKDQIVTAFTYDHDLVGNRLSKATPDKRYDYDYDVIYRLLEASPVRINQKGKEIEDRHNTEEFSYDPLGNRLSGPEWKDSYTYDNGNQLLESRKYDYQYDSNGNLISKIEFDDDYQTSWTYEYDYENRLVRAIKTGEDETKIVSFKYDPFNRRIEKEVEEIEDDKVEAKIFTYVYDGADLILEIETGDGGKGKEKATRYVYGLGTSEPLAIEQKDEVYYYHLDGLNTPVALTDRKGKVVVSYEYSAFGERKHYGNRVKQYLTFPGQYYDTETGLHYNWNRYYDPETGRYITYDPILMGQGRIGREKNCSKVTTFDLPSFESLIKDPKNLNPFSYANNNPVSNIDSKGLYCGSGSTDAIINDAPGGYNFSLPCKGHDDCYGTCGISKVACDISFYATMTISCSSNTFFNQLECQNYANLYFTAVTFGGGRAYSKAQDKACEQCGIF
jgi:RHS repeat-associated protein